MQPTIVETDGNDPLLPGDFLPPHRETRVFGRMRRRMIATTLWQAASHAKFRLSLVACLTGLLWCGMLLMFVDGFSFIKSTITQPSIYQQAVGGIFSAFFFALMLMLLLSSAIILYASLFRSPEAAFLLSMPARTQRIFLYKFQEAVVLSSWGFVLLGSPILLAYGLVARAPWYYYAMLLPFVMSFVYIPVSIGAILCLWIVRRFPDRRSTLLVGGLLLTAVCGVWIAWGLTVGPQNNLLTPDWFREILGRLRFSEQRMLPNWWLGTGLLAASTGKWAESVMFLALMISNALFLRQIAVWTAGRTYRAAYSGLYGRILRRSHSRPQRFDRLLDKLLRTLPKEMRLMMVKDVRLFRRDPLQWSQFLIFFGLLMIYFFNIRRFTYDVASIGWVNMVSFLNLAVVGLLLSTFTTRFVYPTISLEGRRFWILGLLGVKRRTILWGKFFFAAGGTLIPCSGLVLLSDVMLGVSKWVTLSHQLTCLMLCLGLAGMAVGLGAWLPNFRADTPSRIAAGFGGTLTLVLSTLYILFIVLLTALPTHFYLATTYANLELELQNASDVGRWIIFWLTAGSAASLVLGLAATFVPLRLGFRAFERMEF